MYCKKSTVRRFFYNEIFILCKRNTLIIRRDCSTVAGNEVETVLEKAYQRGMSVGIVTTTYVTHASPGAAYAKSDSRSWYSDGSIIDYYDGVFPEEHKPCKDIATQLFEKAGNLTVVMGGGWVENYILWFGQNIWYQNFDFGLNILYAKKLKAQKKNCEKSRFFHNM